MNISSISVSGPNRDHLVIDIAFDPLQGGRPLTREINTDASLKSATLTEAVLNVSATGVEEPIFQYRFENGLWRPAQLIRNGRLVIAEPRLGLKSEQIIEVRALGYNTMRRFDPTPARVKIPAPDERLVVQDTSAPNYGCQTYTGKAKIGFGGLSLLLILILFRRTSLIFGVLFSSWLCGCANTSEAPDLECTQDSQCPIDTSCRAGRCHPDRVCSKNAECCSFNICIQGRCRPDPDDCAQSDAHAQACQMILCRSPMRQRHGLSRRILLSWILPSGPPCGGQCSENEVCLLRQHVRRLIQHHVRSPVQMIPELRSPQTH